MAEPNSADFVVIGSGIIGSLTAHKLAKAGASVLILEAGPRVTRGELVARFRNSPRRSDWMSPYPPAPWAPHPIYQPKDNGYLVQAGPYPYPAEYIRQVGGTTWHWAAHAWRNVPNDFRIHSLYGVGVDWPLTYEDLEPFYQEAEVLMGVSGAPNTGSPRSKPFPMQPVAEPYAMRRIRERLAPAYEVVTNTTARNSRSYDGRPACCGNNSCQPICPIDAQYHGGLAAAAAEAAGVKLLANANVYKLEHDETGRITAALYYDPEKRSHRVTGKTFIVAANGIESPRLLLLSVSDKFPKGLANSSDMVGRNLMDHPSTSLTGGNAPLRQTRPLRRPFGLAAEGGEDRAQPGPPQPRPVADAGLRSVGHRRVPRREPDGSGCTRLDALRWRARQRRLEAGFQLPARISRRPAPGDTQGAPGGSVHEVHEAHREQSRRVRALAARRDHQACHRGSPSEVRPDVRVRRLDALQRRTRDPPRRFLLLKPAPSPDAAIAIMLSAGRHPLSQCFGSATARLDRARLKFVIDTCCRSANMVIVGGELGLTPDVLASSSFASS